MANDLPSDTDETRVLFLAPTARDGRITRELLMSEGVACVVCDGLTSLSREASAGVGVILLTEEAVAADEIEQLLAVLSDQPPWSDVPVVIMMRGGNASHTATHVLRAMTNVTLLERPAPMRSLVSAVKAAIRARQRQYQVRQLLEREQAARAELERVGRMKDEFLATLSHELRTPLNAILGWAQLMNGRNADAETIQEGIAVIDRNARVQVQLIEDLLDMSRIISGKIRLTLEATDPRDFVDAAIETVRPAAEAKGITLRRSIDERTGPIVGDSSRLQQVVWNLLSNAIKFTPKGGTVEARVARRSADGAGDDIEISVTDTGNGIKPNFLPHVFERFRQADASTTRAYGGLGLGLAIVKNLVELHGGTVAASSDGEGKGATFTVVLPLAKAHDDQRAMPDIPALPTPEPPAHCGKVDLFGVKVLVVDDELDARRLVRRILQDCNAIVFTAASASEALEVIRAVRPDVLVSDIGMPHVDGYELLHRVRASEPADGPQIPAIALTAFASANDRARALNAGYHAHVTKPVDSQDLVAAIAKVVGRAPQAA